MKLVTGRRATNSPTSDSPASRGSLANWLTQVVEEDAGDVLAYLERRTPSPEEAADLLGETLLIATRRANDLPRDPERARMWLFVTARNALANQTRARHRHDDLIDRLREEIATQHRNTPTHEDTTAADSVRAAVHALPPTQRELVMLVHWDGFSLTDAATLTDISPSTARSRHARARELLTAHLTPRSATAPDSSPTKVPADQRQQNYGSILQPTPDQYSAG